MLRRSTGGLLQWLSVTAMGLGANVQLCVGRLQPLAQPRASPQSLTHPYTLHLQQKPLCKAERGTCTLPSSIAAGQTAVASPTVAQQRPYKRGCLLLPCRRTRRGGPSWCYCQPMLHVRAGGAASSYPSSLTRAKSAAARSVCQSCQRRVSVKSPPTAVLLLAAAGADTPARAWLPAFGTGDTSWTNSLLYDVDFSGLPPAPTQPPWQGVVDVPFRQSGATVSGPGSAGTVQFNGGLAVTPAVSNITIAVRGWIWSCCRVCRISEGVAALWCHAR